MSQETRASREKRDCTYSPEDFLPYLAVNHSCDMCIAGSVTTSGRSSGSGHKILSTVLSVGHPGVALMNQ